MKKKPNILFILSDQHNAKLTGYNNHPIIKTPNMDKLAETGAVFSTAYCQNPLCVPSRSSLITGKYCKEIGIYDNRHIMESNQLTMPRVFSNNGYQTVLIGKAHFNGEQFQGYQQRPYGDLYGQGHQPDPSREANPGESGLGGVLTASKPSGIPLAMTQTEICVSEAAKWLQTYSSSNTDQPFFMSLHFDKPHFPMCPPKNFYDMYDGLIEPEEIPKDFWDNAPPFVKESIKANGCYQHFGKDREVHKRSLTAYYGCISWIDDAIGRVLDCLNYLGLGEDTIIIYASDHGEMMSKNGAWNKSLFYDNSSNVPFVINYPSKIKPQIINEPVGLIDAFPTLCDMADIDIPEICQGITLSGLMQGEEIERQEIFSESVAYKKPDYAGCMIRGKKYKFNYYLDGVYELFDMINDKEEHNNLGNNPKYADIVEKYKQMAIEFWKPEEQKERFLLTPMMKYDKHHYPYSNQFISANGTVYDAKP